MTDEPKRVVLLNHSSMTDEIASIHRIGCRDIKRDTARHGSYAMEYATVEEALADYIDEEMEEMGWGRDDVKVHACARGL